MLETTHPIPLRIEFLRIPARFDFKTEWGGGYVVTRWKNRERGKKINKINKYSK